MRLELQRFDRIVEINYANKNSYVTRQTTRLRILVSNFIGLTIFKLSRTPTQKHSFEKNAFKVWVDATTFAYRLSL